MLGLILKVFKIPGKIWQELKILNEYIYFRLTYRPPSLPGNCGQKRFLVCGGEDLKSAGGYFRHFFHERAAAKIKEADLICGHVFDLLGSGPVKLSKDGEGYQPIDWHSDFKAHYRWNPGTFYKKIKCGHIEGVDIKVPWELSRFQHLNTLGQAYILTQDRKYQDEFVAQVSDWIDSNPVAFGVNWSCTMDVALRAANWLAAKEFFEESNLPESFLKKFYLSIYEHGKFIRKHLEYLPSFTSNHYIADLAGLFFISVYCPFFEESASWQQFCLIELEREIQKQVYDDGCDFEASTSYHRLVLEMLFYCELLGKMAGKEFSQSFQAKVRKMFEFSLYCVKPNGNIPQIGDNDNGRFLVFSSRPVLEHKYLLSLAAIFYSDSEFKSPEFDFDEEAFWVFGEQGRKEFAQLSARADSLKSRSFPNAGWYIIRNNNDYCFISCGSNGQYPRGGHAHNDKLSFELSLEGKDVLVDPGSFAYTSSAKWRNIFRSTGAHNTVQLSQLEQNDLTGNLFLLGNDLLIKSHSLHETMEEIIFAGDVEYGCLAHSRTIKYNKKAGSFIIADSVSSQQNIESLRIKFILSPDLIFLDKHIVRKKSKETISSVLTSLNVFKIEEQAYSPSYGVRGEAEALVIACNPSSFKKEIITTFEKYA